MTLPVTVSSPPPAPITPLGAARTARRYLAVSAVATPANLGLYFALVQVQPGGLTPAAAAVVAALVISPATYLAYRKLVWSRQGRSSRAEVTRYWVMTVLAVALATVVAHQLARLGVSATMHAAGNLASYTAIWFVRFFVLDRLVFVEPAGVR